MTEHSSSPVEWVGQEHLGFVINAAFSNENIERIGSWLEGLHKHAPEGLYTMRPGSLHITVLDWIAPLFEYGGADKRELYNEVRTTYEPAFRSIVNTMSPFDVQFAEIRVTPGAIIMLGQDNGQFHSLRSGFMNMVQLPEGGKQPPDIIHSSLARFIAPRIDLTPVERYVTKNPLTITQPISEFRLIETRREPMQDFTVLDTFVLAH